MTASLTDSRTIRQNDMFQICNALVSLLDPFGEVVLHDLETQKIVHITGHLSQRQVGDASFLDDFDLRKDPGPVFGPYRKTNPDGRQIKSISVVLHGDAGQPARLLCINMDTSRFEAAHAVLSTFISVPTEDRGNPLADDWLDNLNRFVADWRISNGITDRSLTVENRQQASDP